MVRSYLFVLLLLVMVFSFAVGARFYSKRQDHERQLPQETPVATEVRPDAEPEKAIQSTLVIEPISTEKPGGGSPGRVPSTNPAVRR